MTVFTRAPAEGETEAGSGKVHVDIVFEVMTVAINRRWWKQYRGGNTGEAIPGKLESAFGPDEVVERDTASRSFNERPGS